MHRTLLVGLTLICLSTGLTAQVQLFARMDASQVVPPLSLSQATGEGEFTLNLHTRRLTYRVLTTCVAPLPSLRVALAPRGVSGGVIIDTLYYGYYDMWENTTRVLTDAEIGTLLSEGAYVQIESSGIAAEEIRGQLVPLSRDLLQAQLTGSQAVPPTPSTATGSLRVAISRPDNMVFYDLSTTGINGVAAILHQGASGQTGSAIIPLTGSFFWWRGQSGPHSDAEIAAIRSGNSYVTIYTAATRTARSAASSRRHRLSTSPRRSTGASFRRPPEASPRVSAPSA